MKPITWLRKFAERGYAGYPVATLGFYGPDARKATKAVLGIIETEEVEPRLHTWGGETVDKDLRYEQIAALLKVPGSNGTRLCRN